MSSTTKDCSSGGDTKEDGEAELSEVYLEDSSQSSTNNYDEKKLDSDNESTDEDPFFAEQGTWTARWTRWIQASHKPLMRGMLAVTRHASTHPISYVVTIIILSIALLIIGLATNFNADTTDDQWSPRGSRPVQHGSWIDDESGFPEGERPFVLIVHKDGNNILGDDGRELAQEGARRVFESLDVLRSTPGYDELCAHPDNVDAVYDAVTGNKTCEVVGITRFWNNTADIFEDQISSNLDAAIAMSASRYPSGRKVDFKQIIGYAGFDQDGIFNYGQTYMTVVLLTPNEDLAKDFEEDALDRVDDLQTKWASEAGNVFRLEYIADRSFEDEFSRAVVTDIPLVPVVFIIMSILCVIIYSKRDRVRSQSLLGFGAVVTVLLAIMSSYGILFICGVPFTNLTPILPFIMFGVGLDDAFIISGSFARTDPAKDVVDRLQDTITDIGMTILLTTVTAAIAFGLGGLSSIPAVFWLVAYAFPTIIVDFIYQITFFVALIVLDDRRMKANHLDCVICCKAKHPRTENDQSDEAQVHSADRAMERYADFLLRPRVKALVVFAFTVLLALSAWSTSQLEQYFDFTEIIPSDSYIQTWWDAYNDWYERSGIRPGVYFRDVNFSDTSIQDQMQSYVDDLASLKEFGGEPPFEFWLRDFHFFVGNNSLEELTFDEQLDMFLSDPLYEDVHGSDIVRDADGRMIHSRTIMNMDEVDQLDVIAQIDALENQRNVTKNQPINKGRKEWAFFTFEESYYIWEFYSVASDEIVLATVVGVVSVSALGLLFIPHWSAIFWVGSMVAILYIDLLGFAQVCGIRVNPVMYISMIMSIGLMVDYVMHITVRFVEIKSTDRQLKAHYTLRTIGASVMVGGLSTLLGIIPLAFSSSEIFFTVFIIFFGLVILGLSHGLILLPVLLSVIGPVYGPGTHVMQEEGEKQKAKEEPINEDLDVEQANVEQAI